MINAMFQGPRRLFNNAFFPAAYVVIGHLTNVEKMFPTISWENLTNGISSFNSKEMGEVALTKLQECTDLFTRNSPIAPLVNGSEPIENIDYFSLAQNSFTAGCDTLRNHSLEIGTAAAIGATTTVVNAILAHTPGMKYWPKTRLVTSIALSTAGVMIGANWGLEQDINPQTIINIAVNVGIIGVEVKAVLIATRCTFKVIRSSTDLISLVIRKSCNGIIFITEKADWGTWPTEPVAPRGSKKAKTSEKRADKVAVVSNGRGASTGATRRIPPAPPVPLPPAVDLHSDSDGGMRSDED